MVENNPQEKLPNTDKEVIQNNNDNVPVSSEQGIDFSEGELEKIETILGEIDQLSNDIEEKGDEITLKTEDFSLLEKNQQILSELYQKGEIFLKQISEHLASYPKGVVESFRDKHIKNKTENLRKRLYYNKNIHKYKILKEQNPNELGVLEKAKKNGLKSFDNIYKNCLPVFKTIEGNNWANSKDKDRAIENVHNLMEVIVKDGLSIEKYDEVFNIIKIYENSLVLTSNKEDNKNFSNIVSIVSRHFFDKINLSQSSESGESEISEDEKISEICRGDPYLILGYLNISNKRGNYEFIEKQIDKIIDGEKENNHCNLNVGEYFEKSLRFNPEKYGQDPRNKRVIFESFKYESILNKNFSYLTKNLYFFKKGLDSLSEDDINKIIESYGSYYINKKSAQLLLSSTNLSENNLKKLFGRIGNYSWEEKENEYSKESFLKHFENSGNQFIPLFKYKQFGLTPENRVSLFKEVVEECSSDDAFVFFNQVLLNYRDVFNEIREEERDGIIQRLIEKSIRGSIEDIRILHTLLPEYDIPGKYKEQINQTFSKVYSRNTENLGKMFGDNQAGVKLSENEEWLLKKDEITPKLEIEFYSAGNMNDFRHFFFDVIEGKKESVDKDFLIKKYAERIDEINAEEYIDLFITKRKIPMSYSGIFLEKIRIGDDLLSQLDTCVRLNQIKEEEYKNILFDLVGKSKYSFAESSLDICFEKNILNDIERRKLLESFVENIIKRASSNSSINSYILENTLDRRYNSANIKDEEKVLFFNKFFKELLKYENLNDKILDIADDKEDYLRKSFTDGKDKEDFIDKLLISNNNQAISKLLDAYLKNKSRNLNSEENNHPIFSEINEEKFNNLFDHGLSLKGLGVSKILISHLEDIPKDKQEILFQYLLSKEDMLEDGKDGEELSNFCQTVAFCIEKDKLKQEGKIISDEDARNISGKMFLSKYLNQEIFSELMNYRKDFLSSDKEILNQFVSSVETKGSIANCYSVLNIFRNKDNPILSKEQVKKLSIKFLENDNLNGDLYQMYLDSTEDNLQFYLDQEVFDKNIKNYFTNYSRNINIGSTIQFLSLQKNEKNKKNNRFVLNSEQEETLNKKLLGQQGINKLHFEQLYDLDKELFDKSLNNTIEERELPFSSISKLILTKQEISEAYFVKIIDYYFSGNDNNNYIFDDICDRYLGNQVFVKEIKEKINNLTNIERRSIYKSKLLQKDLLNPEELKAFYEEIRSEPNVYSQVLLSAEVLGSLVYSDNLEKENIFKSENKETQKNIELISSFVKRYPLENKGRTIAVMLFSREYLPERSMDEVIEKVSDTLLKYERTLDQYKYKGIPAGLNVSIGMEYEITRSTADGYKELKNRELKSDIVRLSQAAHIGNGRDAVHEIATRPTTNPYLLLLEMQLLNDIEYIDLNFERTESYQKGARGYHITIGGEKGLNVNANTNFLQNLILAASWGGIHAGEIGKRVSGGRGVTLRGRSAGGGNNNVKVFEEATNSVELRSLSIDKMEPFQRAVTTIYNGAIAIQALEKYTNCTSDQIYKFIKSDSSIKTEKDFVERLKESNLLKEGYDSDEKNMKIIYAWAEMTSSIKDALDYHNNEFLSGETAGYIDKDGVWVDTKDFGGNYNNNRFNSVVSSIDPTLSVEEYVNSTKIDFNEFFSSFDTELADSLTKINNLYLKPDNKIKDESGKEISLGGDQANAISMLEITKLNNENLEYRNDGAYLKGTVFDTLGERREGYYCVQGGSEKMLTHACQIALLNFNKKIEEIVNK